MPGSTYEIQVGGQTYEVQFDHDASEDEIKSAAQQIMASSKPAQPKPAGSRLAPPPGMKYPKGRTRDVDPSTIANPQGVNPPDYSPIGIMRSLMSNPDIQNQLAVEDAQGLKSSNPNYDPSMDYATNYGRTPAPQTRAANSLLTDINKAAGKAYTGAQKAVGGTVAATLNANQAVSGAPQIPFNPKMMEAIGTWALNLAGAGENPMDTAINMSALGPAHLAGQYVLAPLLGKVKQGGAKMVSALKSGAADAWSAVDNMIDHLQVLDELKPELKAKAREEFGVVAPETGGNPNGKATQETVNAQIGQRGTIQETDLGPRVQGSEGPQSTGGVDRAKEVRNGEVQQLVQKGQEVTPRATEGQKDNPFRKKANNLQAQLSQLESQMGKQGAPSSGIAGPSNYKMASQRNAQISQSVDTAVAHQKLTAEFQRTQAMADAFDRGEIHANGQPVKAQREVTPNDMARAVNKANVDLRSFGKAELPTGHVITIEPDLSSKELRYAIKTVAPDGSVFTTFSQDIAKDGKQAIKEALADYRVAATERQTVPQTATEPVPKPQDVVSPVEPPKPQEVTPPVAQEPDLTGFAKQINKRPPLKGTNPQEMYDSAIAVSKQHPAILDEVEKRLTTPGEKASAEDAAFLGVRLRELTNESNALSRQAMQETDPMVKSVLADKQNELAQRIAAIQHAGDLMGNEWHRMGIAHQIPLAPDMSLASLKSRIHTAGLTEDAVKMYESKLEDMANRHLQAMDAMQAERDSLFDQLQKLKEAKVTRPASQAARDRNVRNLKTYFATEKGGFVGEGMASRKAGAANYTLPDTDKYAMQAARSLAREATDAGATNLDQVLDYMRKQIGADIPDDQLLRLISDKYRSYMLEADVAKLHSDRLLRTVQRASEDALRPQWSKAVEAGKNVLHGTQRALQTGQDLSAPFMQGRKGLFADPKSWFKSWGPMMKSLQGEEAAINEYAKITQHPAYAKAKAAGLDFAEPSGGFSHQEEVFAGNVVEAARKSKIPIIKQYAEALVRSEYAYTTFLNRLRMDTFASLAKAAPNDPAYLRDIASTINTIYGRGSSDLAKAARNAKGLGSAIYAPGYTISQWEHATLRPVRTAETALGRNQALAFYGKQAAAYGALAGVAHLFGWDVDWDPRSSNFGKISHQYRDGNKSGRVYADLFSRDAQPVKLLMQSLFGKISTTGKYQPASFQNTAGVLGQYAMGKMAPLPRTASMAAFGNYDSFQGSQKATGADYAKQALPLWVQQSLENNQHAPAKVSGPAAALAAVGIDVNVGPNVSVPHPPFRIGNH